jgi:hypothetical protein
MCDECRLSERKGERERGEERRGTKAEETGVRGECRRGGGKWGAERKERRGQRGKGRKQECEKDPDRAGWMDERMRGEY